MLHKLSLEIKQKGKIILVLSLIVSFVGLIIDSDKVEISVKIIMFEYLMMTLIIFSILFIGTVIIKNVFSMLRNL
jgi:hypothetical protein